MKTLARGDSPISANEDDRDNCFSPPSPLIQLVDRVLAFDASRSLLQCGFTTPSSVSTILRNPDSGIGYVVRGKATQLPFLDPPNGVSGYNSKRHVFRLETRLSGINRPNNLPPRFVIPLGELHQVDVHRPSQYIWPDCSSQWTGYEVVVDAEMKDGGHPVWILYDHHASLLHRYWVAFSTGELTAEQKADMSRQGLEFDELVEELVPKANLFSGALLTGVGAGDSPLPHSDEGTFYDAACIAQSHYQLGRLAHAEVENLVLNSRCQLDSKLVLAHKDSATL